MKTSLPAASFGSLHSTASGWFGRLASKTAQLSGKPITFLLAGLTVAVWAILGPVFHYSDTWQLVINTGTTIITFLMVFLIQNTPPPAPRTTEASRFTFGTMSRAIGHTA